VVLGLVIEAISLSNTGFFLLTINSNRHELFGVMVSAVPARSLPSLIFNKLSPADVAQTAWLPCLTLTASPVLNGECDKRVGSD